jgi:hypothetical protein
MSKSRLVLLALLAVGPLLHIAVRYGVRHPHSPFGNPAITLLAIYMLIVPIVLWRMSGELFVRTVMFCGWVAYLVLWGIGIYRMYTS